MLIKYNTHNLLFTIIMSNLFRSQSQQQKQEPQNNGNTFNRKNTVTTTTKKTPAAAIYMHNEANFPEFISTKKDDVADTKPNSVPMSMYANVVSAVISPTPVVDSTVPAGWTQITLDKKTHKMEVIETTINEKKQKLTENTTNKIIKELDYRWYKYKVEYDLIHGENAFHEAHYTAPIYPYLDAELDTDSEMSDHSNEYDTDL
jgi:hypothetical protein